MKLVELPINKINPSVFQPRELFTKDELEELAQSIKDHGLLNPIHVIKNGSDTYEIIAGERRWRAAQLVGLTKIQAFVKKVTLEEQRIQSLVENVHRTDLSMIEKGRGMMEVFKSRGITKSINEIISAIHKYDKVKYSGGVAPSDVQKIINICSEVNKSYRTIRSWLESISANEEVIKEHIETPKDERVSDQVVARVSTIKEPELQKKTYQKIKQDKMGSTQASKFISQIKKLDKNQREAILQTKSTIEVVGDRKTGYAINVMEDEEQISNQILTTPVKREQKTKSTVKHIDKITRSQLYIEKNTWNVLKFVDQIKAYTIGTDGKHLEDMIDILNRLKKENQKLNLVVVDARDTPYSRYKPEFNKSNLNNGLSEIGVDYIHMKKLGISKNLRKRLFSEEISEKELWDLYKNEILLEPLKQQVLNILKEDKTPIFLCTEISPIRCHRHIIADWLEKEENILCWDL